MRTIDKLYNVAARHKLMVTTDRAVIRFKSGASDEECSRVEKFLTRVVDETPIHATTLRGHLAHHQESDTFYIVLATSSKHFSVRYVEFKNLPINNQDL